MGHKTTAVTPASEDIRAWVRDVPDFPKPGILFRDLTPLMTNAAAFRSSIDQLAQRVLSAPLPHPDVVVAIEARGFVFGAPLAALLGVGFAPIRKPGKLPHKTRSRRYDLEYGHDGVEIHEDAFAHGSRVLLVDDVLATGGTAAAAVHLLRDLGAQVVGALFVLELGGLHGRQRLPGLAVDALVAYD